MTRHPAVSRGATLIVVSMLLAGATCRRTPPPSPEPEAPEFAAFGAAPTRLCTNIGIPIVRLAWRVEGSGPSCLSNLQINGSAIDGDIWATGIQDGRCGEDNYSRELAFSVAEVFGNNIPSSMTFRANLRRSNQASVLVGSELLDSSTATVEAVECSPGITPGG